MSQAVAEKLRLPVNNHGSTQRGWLSIPQTLSLVNFLTNPSTHPRDASED